MTHGIPEIAGTGSGSGSGEQTEYPPDKWRCTYCYMLISSVEEYHDCVNLEYRGVMLLKRIAKSLEEISEVMRLPYNIKE